MLHLQKGARLFPSHSFFHRDLHLFVRNTPAGITLFYSKIYQFLHHILRQGCDKIIHGTCRCFIHHYNLTYGLRLRFLIFIWLDFTHDFQISLKDKPKYGELLIFTYLFFQQNTQSSSSIRLPALSSVPSHPISLLPN